MAASSHIVRRAQALISLLFAFPPRFSPPELELRFRSRNATQLGTIRRAGIAFALFIWCASLYFDVSATDAFALTRGDIIVLLERLVGTLAIIVGGALSLSRRFLDHAFSSGIIFCFSSLCYILLLSMVLIPDYPLSYIVDYVGLILTLFLIVMIFRPGARLMVGLISLLVPLSVGGLSLASATARHAPDIALVNEVFRPNPTLPIIYLCEAALIAYVIACQLERATRASFQREISLEEVNAFKSRFLADAAHDLSQPAHALGMLTATLEIALEERSLDRVRDLVDKTSKAARLARRTFQDVLELSRSDSGQMKVDLSVFDVDELVREIAGSLASFAQEKGVGIRFRQRNDRLAVISDRNSLERVLNNIVVNAIKYSDKPKDSNRRVFIAVLPLKDALRIDVVDNGVGIPKHKLDDIFQRFTRLYNPLHDQESGMGLGLSIVESIMKSLPGHELCSPRSVEGVGTRFSLRIPRYHRAWTPASVEAQRIASQVDLSSLFIWYVEDDELARTATVEFFGELGITTDHAASYERLEKEIAHTERRPDLLITDYALPNRRTADDVIALFIGRWDADIPVLILTGEQVPHRVQTRPRRLRVLQKPASAFALLEAIQDLCIMDRDR